MSDKVLVVVGKREDRFGFYRKLKPDLVILPEIEIAKSYHPESIVWSSQLPGRQKTKLWLDMLKNQAKKPVISTRTGVFLPFNRLSTIVLDDPRHPGQFESRRPRYWAYRVALRLSRLHGARLVVGMPVMSVNGYYHVKTARYKLIKLPSRTLPKIILKTPTSGEIPLQGRVLYFLPQKGHYRGTVCQDCSEIQSFPAPTTCPFCRSTNFAPYGIGVEALAERLERIYQKKVLLVDQNHSIQNYPLPINNYQLTVATHKIFDYDLKFDTTIVGHFDHLLQLPDPFENEKIFETLLKLAQMTKNQMIIETRFSGHPAVKLINQSKTFYEQELTLRRAGSLPPFVRLVKLYSAKKLPPPKFKQDVNKSAIHTNMAGEYQIILKLKPDTPISNILGEMAGWQLDPDPVSLL